MHDPRGSAPIPVPDVLTVYGAPWCGDCRVATRYLDGAGVTYRYVDLAADRAAQAMLDDAGIRAIPVVVTPGGIIHIEPTERELAAAVSEDVDRLPGGRRRAG